MFRLLLGLVFAAVVRTAAGSPDEAGRLSEVSLADLVDRLQDATPRGVPKRVADSSFWPVRGYVDLGGGAFRLPIDSPAAMELVRRGPAAIAVLLNHLTDARPTKLVYVVRPTLHFIDAYESRHRTAVEGVNTGWHAPATEDDVFTFKVGDLCWAALGQIVNRDLRAVRRVSEEPIINEVRTRNPGMWFAFIESPVARPELAAAARHDWAAVTPDLLAASLREDGTLPKGPWATDAEALIRLRFYFPEKVEGDEGLPEPYRPWGVVPPSPESGPGRLRPSPAPEGLVVLEQPLVRRNGPNAVITFRPIAPSTARIVAGWPVLTHTMDEKGVTLYPAIEFPLRWRSPGGADEDGEDALPLRRFTTTRTMLARGSTKLAELEGYLELVVPQLDPEATVELGDLERSLGEPIDSAPLRRGGVKVLLYDHTLAEGAGRMETHDGKVARERMTPGDVAVAVEDPGERVAGLEFFDATGEPLRYDRRGRQHDQSMTRQVTVYAVRAQLAQSRLRVYLKTERSFVTHRFRFVDVPIAAVKPAAGPASPEENGGASPTSVGSPHTFLTPQGLSSDDARRRNPAG